jgi:hypothetical protein
VIFWKNIKESSKQLGVGGSIPSTGSFFHEVASKFKSLGFLNKKWIGVNFLSQLGKRY